MADPAHGKIEGKYLQDNPKILSGPVLTNSPNAVLSKTLLSRYYDLPLPADKIIATYVWIDGSGEHMRCKDRTLNFIPKQPKDKLARLLEDLNENYVSKINKNMKWEHLNQYLPPYFFPRDLESVFEARCMLGDRENTDSFDENLKGFTAILSSAVVEML